MQGLFQLNWSHACNAKGCASKDCELCRHCSSRRCNCNLKPKYVTGDLLQANCGGNLELSLVDYNSTHVGLPSGCEIKLSLLNDKKYSQFPKREHPLSTDKLQSCEVDRPQLKWHSGKAVQCISITELQAGVASLSGLKVIKPTANDQHEKQSGQTTKYRLWIRITDADGMQLTTVNHIVSDAFTVVTSRSKSALKSTIPMAGEPVGRLEGIGSDAAAALATLGQTIEAEADLPVHLASVATVHDFWALVNWIKDAGDSQGRQQQLRDATKLKQADYKRAADHVQCAVFPDFRPRVWWWPGTNAGLLFSCKNAVIQFEAGPVAGIIRSPGQHDLIKTLDATQLQQPAMQQAVQMAKESWPQQQHGSSWALYWSDIADPLAQIALGPSQGVLDAMQLPAGVLNAAAETLPAGAAAFDAVEAWLTEQQKQQKQQAARLTSSQAANMLPTTRTAEAAGAASQLAPVSPEPVTPLSRTVTPTWPVQEALPQQLHAEQLPAASMQVISQEATYLQHTLSPSEGMPVQQLPPATAYPGIASPAVSAAYLPAAVVSHLPAGLSLPDQTMPQQQLPEYSALCGVSISQPAAALSTAAVSAMQYAVPPRAVITTPPAAVAPLAVLLDAPLQQQPLTQMQQSGVIPGPLLMGDQVALPAFTPPTASALAGAPEYQQLTSLAMPTVTPAAAPGSMMALLLESDDVPRPSLTVQQPPAAVMQLPAQLSAAAGLSMVAMPATSSGLQAGAVSVQQQLAQQAATAAHDVGMQGAVASMQQQQQLQQPLQQQPAAAAPFAAQLQQQVLHQATDQAVPEPTPFQASSAQIPNLDQPNNQDEYIDLDELDRLLDSEVWEVQQLLSGSAVGLQPPQQQVPTTLASQQGGATSLPALTTGKLPTAALSAAGATAAQPENTEAEQAAAAAASGDRSEAAAAAVRRYKRIASMGVQSLENAQELEQDVKELLTRRIGAAFAARRRQQLQQDAASDRGLQRTAAAPEAAPMSVKTEAQDMSLGLEGLVEFEQAVAQGLPNNITGIIGGNQQQQQAGPSQQQPQQRRQLQRGLDTSFKMMDAMGDIMAAFPSSLVGPGAGALQGGGGGEDATDMAGLSALFASSLEIHQPQQEKD